MRNGQSEGQLLQERCVCPESLSNSTSFTIPHQVHRLLIRAFLYGDNPVSNNIVTQHRTLLPEISTSHSASSQLSRLVSAAACPATMVSSGHVSSGGIIHCLLPGRLVPQCSTSSEAMSVMMSTRTGIACGLKG